VVAGRVATCVVGGNVPFSDLCMYGRNNDLRGYTTGQYRDKAMLAAQAEVRWSLAHRWARWPLAVSAVSVLHSMNCCSKKCCRR